MKDTIQTFVRCAARATLLLALLGVVSCSRQADSPAADAAAPASGSSAAAAEGTPDASAAGGASPMIDAPEAADAPVRILDPRADEILRAMSALLASTARFALEAEESFDEIPSGQPRVLFTNLRRIAVARPNRFAADAEGDSLSRSVWYDGRTVSALDKATFGYATIQAPGSIDDALDMLVEKYGIDVPLADLFYADPYATLTEEVTYSRYLGIHRAAGVHCHHLVFAQPTIEWQIWIDAGEKPLPRKLAITYVREPGEPQYVATIARWNLSPALDDALFQFAAPEGAQRVDAAALIAQRPGAPR
jgi:hypothetical protein